MDSLKETIITVGAHSEQAPPAYFETPIYPSFDSDIDAFVKRVFEREEKDKTYTVGFRDNPDHVWKVVDYAICSPDKSPSSQPKVKYLVLYYEPENIASVIKDCLPHLVDLPENDQEESIDDILESRCVA